MENKSDINENCIYCGTSLNGMCQPHKRKYCSTTCSNKYRLRQKKPDVQSKLWQHEPYVFENAMKMYWDGYGGSDIAQCFNIPVGTVYSWIHDFGSENKRIELMKQAVVNRPVKKPLKERFRTAESADEWIEALRDSMLQYDDTFEGLSVNLVCGFLHGQSVGKLAAVVMESLKEDPMSGKSYAFCNKCRNTISVLAWKAPVYHVSKYVRTHGTFIWPGEELGLTIEISRAEFDRLIFLQKSKKASPELLEKTSKIIAENTMIIPQSA